MRQVESLLRNRHVVADNRLRKIFEVVERDEPSHWMPYEDWLSRNGRIQPRWWEKLVNLRIHGELMLIRIPAIFVNWRAARCAAWPDAADPALPA